MEVRVFDREGRGLKRLECVRMMCMGTGVNGDLP